MSQIRSPSYCIFIPAYNAENTLPGVLKRIPEGAWDSISCVYIINDGSQDATSSVCQKLKEQYTKIETHSFVENKGYGQAVKKGLACAQKDKSDYAVCLHADGQYPPEYIDDFVRSMVKTKIDILQGSRHLRGGARQGGMPYYKIIAGKVLVFLENLVFGMDLTDYHSGFVLYSRHALSSIPFETLSPSFDFDLEVIATACSKGLTIREKSIPAHYGDEKSYLNPITYGLRVLRVLVRYLCGYYKNL